MPIFKRTANLFSSLFTGSELAENRRKIVMEQFFSGTSNAMVTGNYFTGLLVLLHLSDTMIGNISVVTQLGNVFQMFSSVFLGRFRRKKKIIIFWKSIVYLLNIVLIGAIPFLGLGPATAGLAILSLTFLITFIGAVIGPGMSSWHVKSIPEPIRSDYFSVFTVALNIVVLAFTFLGGRVVDTFKATGMGLLGLTFLRLFAVLTAVFDLMWLRKIPEYPEEVTHSEQGISLKSFSIPLRDQNYRKTIFTGILWSFTSAIPGPYYNLYLLKDLDVPYSTLALINMGIVAALIVFVPLWTRRMKRTSHFHTFGFLMRLFLLHYVVLSLVSEKSLVLYPIGAFYSFIFYAGISVIVFGLPFVNIAETGQIRYLSSYSALSSVAAFLGTEFGTLFITFTAGFSLPFFPVPFHNAQLLMVVTAFLMFLSTFLIRSLKEKNTEGQEA